MMVLKKSMLKNWLQNTGDQYKSISFTKKVRMATNPYELKIQLYPPTSSVIAYVFKRINMLSVN